MTHKQLQDGRWKPGVPKSPHTVHVAFLNPGRADAGCQELWRNGRITFQDTVRMLTERNIKGRRTPGTQSGQRMGGNFLKYAPMF